MSQDPLAPPPPSLMDFLDLPHLSPGGWDPTGECGLVDRAVLQRTRDEMLFGIWMSRRPVPKGASKRPGEAKFEEPPSHS